VSNEAQEGLLKLVGTGKMVGLQKLALQKTEPNLDLIQPGGIGGQQYTWKANFLSKEVDCSSN